MFLLSVLQVEIDHKGELTTQDVHEGNYPKTDNAQRVCVTEDKREVHYGKFDRF